MFPVFSYMTWLKLPGKLIILMFKLLKVNDVAEIASESTELNVILLYEEQFQTLDCLFFIVLLTLFPLGNQIFYELINSCLESIKLAVLFLWDPLLYFVLFCN